MKQPQGFVNEEHPKHVCRLKRSLYGLKQAPMVWNNDIDNYLKKLGLAPTTEDPCLYKLIEDNELKFMLFLYVDDILFAGPRKLIDKFKGLIKSKYPLTDLGKASYVIGYEIHRDRLSRKIILHQAAYINKLFERTNMIDCKPAATLAPSGRSLKKEMSPKTREEIEIMAKGPYRETTGGPLYLSTGTRPDIAEAVWKLCQFNNDPGPQHWSAVKHLLRYLKITQYVGVELGGLKNDLKLRAWADADWGGCLDTRRSTSGIVIQLGNSTIQWKSRRQASAALSTMEAEFYALSLCTQEVMYFRKLMYSLGLSSAQESTKISQDNQACIIHAGGKVITRAKHIDLQYQFVKEKVQLGVIELQYLPSEQMAADLLTKPLTRDKHNKNMQYLNLRAA